MKNRKLLRFALTLSILFVFAALFSLKTAAQTPANDGPNYLLREYMKVEPGQEENYLINRKTLEKNSPTPNSRRQNSGLDTFASGVLWQQCSLRLCYHHRF